jgi:uncharacterized membrane protein HdeD (DUF308 family)
MTTIIDTMNANTTPTRPTRWPLALGIVQIVVGGIAIAVPIVASLAAVAIFGAVLIVTAVLERCVIRPSRRTPDVDQGASGPAHLASHHE